MNTQQQQLADAERLSVQANTAWRSKNRELLAYVAEDHSTFWRAMASFLQLEALAEINSVTPSIEAYEAIISRAFVTLLEDGTIHLAEPISSLAQAALTALRRATGLGVEHLPALPAPAKTLQEEYEESVIHLWETLPSDHFRARLNADRKMRETFKALSETNRIAARGSRKPEAATERELAEGQRLVMVDQNRYVSSVADGQISVSSERNQALIMTQQEAESLRTRLKKAHFPMAAVVA